MYNGITLKAARSDKDHGGVNLTAQIFQFALAAGIMLCINEISGFGVSSVSIAAALIVSCAMLIPLKNKTAATVRDILPFAVAGIIVIIFHKAASQGLLCTAKGIVDAWGESRMQIMPNIVCNTPDNEWAFSACLSALITAFFSLEARRGQSVLQLFCAAAVIIFSGLTDRISAIGIALVIVSSCGAFVFRSAKGFSKKLALAAAAAFVLSTIAAYALPQSAVETAYARTLNVVDDMRYGKSVMPDGDLTHLEGFHPSDSAALEIVMSQPDSYYLRGFIGESYSDGKWQSDDSGQKYQNSELFYQLHKNGFYGQTQLSQLTSVIDSENYETSQMHINIINASKKYVYAPYETAFSSTPLLPSDGIGDCTLLSQSFTGENSYSLNVCQNQVKRYTELTAKLSEAELNADKTVSEYLNAEAHYNEYVYDTYLDIPESARSLFDDLTGGYQADGAHLDYAQAKQNIISYITEGCSYSENVTSDGGDVLSEFLISKRRGYSVHFATAAALMFRYYGIPARYAEGYLITPETAKNAAPNTAVTVKQSDAHAWVEFYQDGAGWIPFEVTPEYLDVMEKADGFSEVDSGSDDNIIPAQPPHETQPQKEQGKSEMTKQPENDRTALVIVISAVSILAVLIAAAVVIAGKIRLKKLKKTFASADRRLAAKNMFIYIRAMLVKLKALSKTDDLYSAHETLSQLYGEEYAAEYSTAFDVLCKATFSNEDISEAERDDVKKLCTATENIYGRKGKQK